MNVVLSKTNKITTIALVLWAITLPHGEAQASLQDTALVETITISSTNPSPVYVTAPIEPGSRYILEATGTFYFAITSSASVISDAAYGTVDGWQSLCGYVGIHPTELNPWTNTMTPGLESLLVDFGDGIQIADWGPYSSGHKYTYEFIANSSILGFVISDWWSTWYGPTFANNAGMGDNQGSLTVNVYKKFNTVPAEVRFNPHTLNLRSDGTWVTAYIQLPPSLNPTDITVSTILLNNSIGSELNPTAIGDFNGDGIPELMVKFSRSAVQAILEAGDSVAITVSGSFANGQRFTGNDAIRIIK